MKSYLFYSIIKSGNFKEAEMKIAEKTQEIKEIISNASTVFLMAHKDLDLDAINSCIGVDYYLKSLKKKSFIIYYNERFFL